MNTNQRRTAWVGVFSILAWYGVVIAQEATQPAAAERAVEAASASQPEVGTVTGANVYVRSGSHQNYYEVTKLNRGDKVTIVGSEFGWLKIAPPAGAYSLVEKSFVDKAGDQAGTANNLAQVYAGSNLNDRRYAKQVKLPKGTRVEILGETSDGAFYKIQPPAGASLWIKGEFVEYAGQEGERTAKLSSPKLEPIKSDEPSLAESAQPTPRSTTTQPAQERTAISRSSATTRPAAEAAEIQSKYNVEIIGIEAEITAEQAKAYSERNYAPLIEKLRPLAAQTQDETAQLYAQARINQLQGHQSIIASYGTLLVDQKATQEAVDRIRKDRERIRVEPPLNPSDIVVQGEIRVSTLYGGDAGRAKRWRVVDPHHDQTLAYIELPPGSPIDPIQYYGKYIGIRASARQILTGTNPPTPVYTVHEIVVLDPQFRQSGSMMERLSSPVTTTDIVPLPPKGMRTAGTTGASSEPMVINLSTTTSPAP